MYGVRNPYSTEYGKNFSKVCAPVILHSKISCKPTFENSMYGVRNTYSTARYRIYIRIFYVYLHTLHACALPLSHTSAQVYVGCQKVVHILQHGVVCTFAHPTHLCGADCREFAGDRHFRIRTHPHKCT